MFTLSTRLLGLLINPETERIERLETKPCRHDVSWFRHVMVTTCHGHDISAMEWTWHDTTWHDSARHDMTWFDMAWICVMFQKELPLWLTTEQSQGLHLRCWCECGWLSLVLRLYSCLRVCVAQQHSVFSFYDSVTCIKIAIVMFCLCFVWSMEFG